MSDQGGGDGAPAGGEGQAPAAVVPAPGSQPEGGDSGGSPPAFTLPEAYKDAPWAKDFKSSDDVFKSLENAQQFIGRKGFGVPGEKATDEDRAAFYKELGVPDAPEGYEFKKPEGVPDEMWNTEHEAKWAGLMKQNNIPKSVANSLRDEMLKETLDSHNTSITELNKALDTAFGDKKLAVTKEVGDMITKAIPDAALRKQIESAIGNKNTPAFALALGHVMNHYKKTYGLSDTNTGDNGGGEGGKSIKEMRAEATALMASPAYTNTMHKDHAETRKQVEGMYATIGQLTDAANKK